MGKIFCSESFGMNFPGNSYEALLSETSTAPSSKLPIATIVIVIKKPPPRKGQIAEAKIINSIALPHLNYTPNYGDGLSDQPSLPWVNSLPSGETHLLMPVLS